MTDPLRVILEIGQNRRVIAGATHWPEVDHRGSQT
jgi:hypothetical protein